MNVQLQPGLYVLAVSGGVDSMSLLHRLAVLHSQSPQQWRFVVAHLDHGIRDDSKHDMVLVRSTAREYGLPFVSQSLQLGTNASEETARKARYEFLHTVQRAANASGIITAHHQDDVIETALINMIRGTDRRGMTAMLQNERVVRPLTHMSKQDILAYAQQNNVQWREDSTNQNTAYTRNYIRQAIMPKLSSDMRAELIEHITKLHSSNVELDQQLVHALHVQEVAGTLDRHGFTQLPHSVAKEAMAMLLRSNGIREYDRRMLERLVVSAKTGRVGQQFPIKKGWYLVIQKQQLALKAPER